MKRLKGFAGYLKTLKTIMNLKNFLWQLSMLGLALLIYTSLVLLIYIYEKIFYNLSLKLNKFNSLL